MLNQNVTNCANADGEELSPLPDLPLDGEEEARHNTTLFDVALSDCEDHGGIAEDAVPVVARFERASKSRKSAASALWLEEDVDGALENLAASRPPRCPKGRPRKRLVAMIAGEHGSSLGDAVVVPAASLTLNLNRDFCTSNVSPGHTLKIQSSSVCADRVEVSKQKARATKRSLASFAMRSHLETRSRFEAAFTESWAPADLVSNVDICAHLETPLPITLRAKLEGAICGSSVQATSPHIATAVRFCCSFSGAQLRKYPSQGGRSKQKIVLSHSCRVQSKSEDKMSHFWFPR